MIGELVADGKAQTVRITPLVDHVTADDLGFLAEVLGEVGRGERAAACDHVAAISLVEPLWLHAGLAGRGLAAFDSPLEHLHRIGELGVCSVNF